MRGWAGSIAVDPTRRICHRPGTSNDDHGRAADRLSNSATGSVAGGSR